MAPPPRRTKPKSPEKPANNAVEHPSDTNARIKKGDPEPTSPRRLAPVKVACGYGHFGNTKCYELINAGRIRAYKFDSKTLIDLDSIDELYAGLRPIEARARTRTK